MRKPASIVGAALVALLPPSLCTAADELTILAHPPTLASSHPPLIVLMHGAGADEKDMIGLWKQLPPQFVVVSPRGLFGGGGGWRWYRKGPTLDADLTTSRKVVDLVVDSAIKRFDVDPARVFIGGFSQGGVMTYEMAMHEPGRFRGAVVMSGTLFPSALAGDPPGSQTTPFFIGQGTADKVILYPSAVAARDTLERRGVKVTFAPYEGMAHTTSDAEIAAVSAWLEKQLGGQPK